MPTVNFSKTGY